MDKQLKFSLAFSAVLVFSAAAVAGSAHDGKGPFMSLFDTNNDSVVTMDEFKQAAAERFQKMDADGNGKVTREEFSSYLKEKRKKRSEARFQKIDIDQSGNVSLEEYLDYKRKRAESKFQRLDTDGDGVISSDEYKNKKRYGKWSRKHGKGGIFAKLDKNSNGEITQEESLQAWSQWFAKIDGNGDKVVTADEVREYREKKVVR